MTIQDTVQKSNAAENLRAKGAEVMENVVEPAAEEIGRAASRAKDKAGDMARDVQNRATQFGEAALERGTEIASDVTEMATRNLSEARSTLREFARKNPELLIAGAALAGIGIAAWLRQPHKH